MTVQAWRNKTHWFVRINGGEVIEIERATGTAPLSMIEAIGWAQRVTVAKKKG